MTGSAPFSLLAAVAAPPDGGTEAGAVSAASDGVVATDRAVATDGAVAPDTVAAAARESRSGEGSLLPPGGAAPPYFVRMGLSGSSDAGSELSGAAAGLLLPQRTAYRDVAPAEFYGAASVAVPPRPFRSSPGATIDDAPLHQGLLLALAAAYAFFVVRHRDDIVRLFGRVRRDTVRARDFDEDSGGSGFGRFLTVAASLGICFAGAGAVKYAAALRWPAWAEAIPPIAAPLLCLCAVAVCIAVAAYQYAALRMAGAVTLEQPLVAQLLRLKYTYFSFGAVVVSPALLLFALAPSGADGVWIGLAAAGSAVTAVLYVRETLYLFLGKKISILHWFLYLCTVELFPVSLLGLLAAR